MRHATSSLLRKLPLIGRVLRERDLLRVPPGHFYSPIPSADERSEAVRRSDDPLPSTLPGIDLNEEGQLELLTAFESFYSELPWSDGPKNDRLRYAFTENAFPYYDAICLYAMIRRVKPARIVEVGCGHSSCVMLDTNELFFGDVIETVFIDPYPELLYRMMKPTDRARSRVLAKRVQDVPLAEFARLEAGDILFIDSTHVAKAQSDVNHLFGAVLPSLATGVVIHLHDVHYPFEYPATWLSEGRGWNEAYVLRAFLQYNERFKTLFFNSFVMHFHRPRIAQSMPLCLKSVGGSIWLRVEERSAR